MYTRIEDFGFHTISGLIGITNGDIDIIVQFIPIKIYNKIYVAIDNCMIIGVDEI